MGQPVTIHSAYAGMSQDMARDQLPPASLWNLVDFIPNALGAPLRKRGGYVYASSSISAATFLRRVMYGSTDLGGSQLLALDSITSTSAGAGLWSVNETTGAVTFIGSVTAVSAGGAAGKTTVGDPVNFGKRWFIPNGYVDSIAGTSAISSAPTLYDGSTLTKVETYAASGGVNGVRYLEVWKSRLVAANGPKHPRRLWFSTAGITKANKFDDKDAWLDVPHHVSGLCTLPTALLVFGHDRTTRIRGSIPPPEPDLVVEQLNAEGCADYRSISTWNGRCLYANTNGIFLTDGIETDDLTVKAGLSNYYRTLLASFTAAWRLRGEVFRNYYFLSISNASDTFVDCLVVDLRSRGIFRLSNFNFHGFSVGTGTIFQQFYATPAATARVCRLTDIFAPASTNKADADGTAILPVVEYPCRRGFFQQARKWLPTQGITHWKRLYFNYDLRDAASDNPTLVASYVTTPESTSYTNFAVALDETTVLKRKGRSFGPSGARGGVMAAALGIKLTQTANSSDTRIYSLESEMEAIEGSRVA